MRNEQRLPTGTPESKAFAERVKVAMGLCARLNAHPFDDLVGRRTLLTDIFDVALPEDLSILPPFNCDYGLNTTFGEKVFVNQGCYLLDFGGVTIGDRVMIGPRVTLATAGHPVELAYRNEFITHAPINIEDDVWIGANVTVTPGVTIGRGSVIGAGSVVTQDVPAMMRFTGTPAVRLRPIAY